MSKQVVHAFERGAVFLDIGVERVNKERVNLTLLSQVTLLAQMKIVSNMYWEIIIY